jgi:hypothetical protein
VSESAFLRLLASYLPLISFARFMTLKLGVLIIMFEKVLSASWTLARLNLRLVITPAALLLTF